mmetsp:Transcript_35663/g.82960  ORF Transcript_35663/g.82960 Transcript_35663/m.82960 type:complete len:230 (-) Transcript_35663:62-751(-)
MWWQIILLAPSGRLDGRYGTAEVPEWLTIEVEAPNPPKPEVGAGEPKGAETTPKAVCWAGNVPNEEVAAVAGAPNVEVDVPNAPVLGAPLAPPNGLAVGALVPNRPPDAAGWVAGAPKADAVPCGCPNMPPPPTEVDPKAGAAATDTGAPNVLPAELEPKAGAAGEPKEGAPGAATAPKAGVGATPKAEEVFAWVAPKGDEGCAAPNAGVVDDGAAPKVLWLNIFIVSR